MKTSLFNRITKALATASQIIIASPVRLPPKVVAVAKYVSLGLALLETIDFDENGDATPRVPTDSGTGVDNPDHGEEEPDDGH